MTGFKKTAGPKFEIPLFRKALFPGPTLLKRDQSTHNWQSSLSGRSSLMLNPLPPLSLRQSRRTNHRLSSNCCSRHHGRTINPGIHQCECNIHARWGIVSMLGMNPSFSYPQTNDWPNSIILFTGYVVEIFPRHITNS
ncbi:hypothetical protein CDAR_595881 [Caerostris darwini]|uniref:Cytochrome c biogenesis B n=1 Tax=Caerostris darwini TaxID=1538125 RepID=A0AAV4QB68_9ARAC|nr:hypothetical protein CDAR_595881 [Caerostris darwini]